MPTIRIDADVYLALGKLAHGFMTPNDVLRNLLGLKGPDSRPPEAPRSRVGRYEYLIEGQWLGSRDYLSVVDATGNAIVKRHQKAFDTVLRGNGNGLSNLAKYVANNLGHSSRESGSAE